MPEHLKKNWISYSFALLVIVLLLAVLFERPVKVSVSDSIFIDFGISEARVGVERVPFGPVVDSPVSSSLGTFMEQQAGPPERYIAVFRLTDGRTVKVLMDGSCRTEGGEE